jgi:hypothetical protein
MLSQTIPCENQTDGQQPHATYSASCACRELNWRSAHPIRDVLHRTGCWIFVGTAWLSGPRPRQIRWSQFKNLSEPLFENWRQSEPNRIERFRENLLEIFFGSDLVSFDGREPTLIRWGEPTISG